MKSDNKSLVLFSALERHRKSFRYVKCTHAVKYFPAPFYFGLLSLLGLTVLVISVIFGWSVIFSFVLLMMSSVSWLIRVKWLAVMENIVIYNLKQLNLIGESIGIPIPYTEKGFWISRKVSYADAFPELQAAWELGLVHKAAYGNEEKLNNIAKQGLSSVKMKKPKI